MAKKHQKTIEDMTDLLFSTGFHFPLSDWHRHRQSLEVATQMKCTWVRPDGFLGDTGGQHSPFSTQTKSIFLANLRYPTKKKNSPNLKYPHIEWSHMWVHHVSSLTKPWFHQSPVAPLCHRCATWVSPTAGTSPAATQRIMWRVRSFKSSGLIRGLALGEKNQQEDRFNSYNCYNSNNSYNNSNR
jgi:hypothetical protein